MEAVKNFTRGALILLLLAILVEGAYEIFVPSYRPAVHMRDISSVSEEFRRLCGWRTEMTLIKSLPKAWKGRCDRIIAEREQVGSRAIEDKDDPKATYTNYIYDICERYPSVAPELVMSVVYHESRWDPSAKNYNGSCVGLMQLATKWHSSRAYRLTGSTNLFDPYTNLATGIDLLNDLISEHGADNLDLVLMRYNGSSDAYSRHASGNPTKYATSVLNYMEVLKSG